MSDVGDEMRALIREVIRDVLPNGLPSVETVNLSTDEDLAAFVARLLDLDAEARDELRAGRKRFRLVAPPFPQTPSTPAVTIAAASGANGTHGPSGLTAVNGSAGPPARRIERGAVTEKVVRDAAQAGERLVLGPGAVLTPLARDRARASGVEISRER
ncbi:MAG TPA: hypothetical protein VKU77_39590 [Streptosporangiaceae bacterium]|nr:hypothetical protein [Streptosporangiaceae bacterium]